VLVAVSLGGCSATASVVKADSAVPKPTALQEFVEHNKMDTTNFINSGLSTSDVLSMADIAYSNADWRVAEKYYRRVSSESPDARSFYRLGNTLLQQAKIDKAIAAYDRALTQDPNHANALKNRTLAHLLSAEMYLEMTVDVLQSENDASAASYSQALAGLKQLNTNPRHTSLEDRTRMRIKEVDTLEEIADDVVATEFVPAADTKKITQVALVPEEIVQPIVVPEEFVTAKGLTPAERWKRSLPPISDK